MELWDEIEKCISELDVSVKNLRRSGTEYAEAERNYKVLLRQEVLKLREAGTPVTLIPLTVYGIEEVAVLRANRDVKQTVYEANKEAINAIKLKIRVIQEQNKQEWGVAQYDS